MVFEVSQIPRIFPKISLDDLKSDESLLKKLTPELIDEVATLFAVRTEWLEGVDDVVYASYSCYKQQRLLMRLQKQKRELRKECPLLYLIGSSTWARTRTHRLTVSPTAGL